MARFGTVELGGTKTSCAVGSSLDDLVTASFPTTTPGETMGKVIEFFEAGSLDAMGIASFGPVELRRDHPDFGRIRLTPKHGWSGTDLVGPIADAFGVPTGFDTDVNGAALGEGRWGSGQGLRTFVYVTVGTGIGGGGLIEGEPIHGLGHPEMGHMTVRRHPEDGYAGVCPFHGDCLEGLASGPAIHGRFGLPGARLSGVDFEQALEIEAFYLAQMVRNLVYTMAPERVILGGGVSQMAGLVDAVADLLPSGLGGYPGLPEHEAGFVATAGLGSDSGLAGGLVLAERALRSSG